MKRLFCVLFTILCCLLLTVPCFAADGDLVRESITVKTAPDLVPIRTEKDEKTGEEVNVIADIVITNEDGTQTVVDSVLEKHILITAYADRERPNVQILALTTAEKEEVATEIKNILENAYEDVSTVTQTIGELHEVVETYLDEASKDLDTRYDSSIYGAIHLFDIWVDDDTRAIINRADTSVTLRFELTTVENENLEVLHKSSLTDTWEAISSDRVSRTEDGKYVDVTFEDLSPVLFLMPSKAREQAIVSACCRRCPSWCPFCPWLCGITLSFISHPVCLCWLPILILILIIILIILLIYKLSKKKDEEAEENEENKDVCYGAQPEGETGTEENKKE